MYEDAKRIFFTCQGEPGGNPQSWEGRLRILRDGEPWEAELEARGSYFHLIVGNHAYGNFICIPNWNVGTELSRLDDLFWNAERLRNYTSMKSVDVCSVAAALKQLAVYVYAKGQAVSAREGCGIKKAGGE